MTHPNRVVLILFLFFSFPQYPCFADQVVKVAVSEWPPFVSKELPKNGFAMDLFQQVLQGTGYTPKLTPIKFEHALIGMMQDEYDMIPALWKRPARERYMNFTEAYLTGKLVIASKRHQKLTSLNQLTNYTLGVVDGYAYPKELLHLKVKKRVYSGEAYQNYLKLVNDKVDYIAVDLTLLKYFNKQYFKDGKKELKEIKPVMLVSEEPLYIGVRKSLRNSKDIVRKINDNMKKLEAEKKIEQLYYHHLNYFYNN